MPLRSIHIFILAGVFLANFAGQPLIRESTDIRHPDYRGYVRIGNYFLGKAEYDESQKYFHKALLLRSAGKEANYGYIKSLKESQKYNLAIKHLKPLLLWDPKNPRYNYYMGEILESTGKVPGAIYFFKRAFRHAINEEQRTSSEWYLSYLKPRLRSYKLTEESPHFVGEIPEPHSKLEVRPPLKVAIFPTENAELRLGLITSNSLANAISECGCCLLLKPARLNVILSEQLLDLFGTITEETAIDLGRALGLDAIVLPRMDKSTEYYKLQVRVLRTEDGTVLMAAGGAATVDNEIYSIADNLAENFANGMLSVR